jgi:uncharacterized membrane protein
MESHLRSWAKSVSWRITGIVILGGISYGFTRNWEQTTWITAIFHTVRFMLYYVHERWWARIAWGRIKHPLSHLPVKADLSPEDHAAIQDFLKRRKCLTTHDYDI